MVSLHLKCDSVLYFKFSFCFLCKGSILVEYKWKCLLKHMITSYKKMEHPYHFFPFLIVNVMLILLLFCFDRCIYIYIFYMNEFEIEVQIIQNSLAAWELHLGSGLRGSVICLVYAISAITSICKILHNCFVQVQGTRKLMYGIHRPEEAKFLPCCLYFL